MPKNRSAVGAETRSRCRKPRVEAGRIWGGGTSPADKGVGERYKQAPSAESGQSPGRKRVLMHLEPVYF